MNAYLSAVAIVSTLSSILSFVAMSLFSFDFVLFFFSSRSLYVDVSSLWKLVVLSAAISSLGSFLMRSVSSFSLLRKGLFTCLNFTDWIIFSMSSSKSFNSSVGVGFLVDLKP